MQARGKIRSDHVTAEIRLADGTLYPRKGTISFIDRQVDPRTSVIAARATFDNPDLFVMPGQFVRITVSGMTLVNTLLIPQQAVIQTQEGSMVVVVNGESRAEMRPVVLGDNYGEYFLVDSGLEPGERIIIEGSNKAVPGQPVRIMEEKPEAASKGQGAVSDSDTSGKLHNQPVTVGVQTPAAR